MKRIVIIVSILVSLLALGIPLWVILGTPGQPIEPSSDDLTVTVLNVQTGQNVTMLLEQYLVGVVAAEMPANFELEALKAQAVAARTYTVKRMFQFGAQPSEQHSEAEVCTDSAHCQAWFSEKELREKWGWVKFYLYYDKIRTAVQLTKGQVLTYQSSLIDPVYHSSCGGRGTENSEDVWSEAVPYLRSVDCSLEYKEEDNVFTMDLTLDQLAASQSTETPAESSPALEALKRSPRGRLQEVKVFGQVMSGSDFRQKLGLTSTLVTWKTVGNTVSFTSIGKGHGVGMCQYGANGMALAGMNYAEILKHYYTGVKLQKMKV